MTAYLTIDEAAVELRKTPRWLKEWLRKTPTDKYGRVFFLKAGRAMLFNADDIARITASLAEQDQRISQRVKDAYDLLPTMPTPNGSVVYFVRGGDLIKIGYSAKWRGRLSNLQTASPVKLELLHLEHGRVSKERALHRRFDHLHSHREWFRAAPELLSYIEMLKRGGAE